MDSRSALLIGLLLLALHGCGGEPSSGPPPPDSFAEYYAGEVFLQEKTRLENGDSVALAIRLDSLRHRYGLTARQRDSLLAYTRESLPRWEAFLETVLKKLESGSPGGKGPGRAKGAQPSAGAPQNPAPK